MDSDEAWKKTYGNWEHFQALLACPKSKILRKGMIKNAVQAVTASSLVKNIFTGTILVKQGAIEDSQDRKHYLWFFVETKHTNIEQVPVLLKVSTAAGLVLWIFLLVSEKLQSACRVLGQNTNVSFGPNGALLGGLWWSTLHAASRSY